MRLTRAGLFLAIAAVSGLAGCANRPPASDAAATAEFEQTNDPIEPTNRFFFDVNDAIDRFTLKPLA